ncbi:hypothetical protein GOODEAATRI_002361 [Goodea atripinnis]|uniref:Uncharacterized protein n=1 Tax=Goodea atripinnis TaxID=208336 RepID=A0ABV0PK47_9TELE
MTKEQFLKLKAAKTTQKLHKKQSCAKLLCSMHAPCFLFSLIWFCFLYICSDILAVEVTKAPLFFPKLEELEVQSRCKQAWMSSPAAQMPLNKIFHNPAQIF